MTKEKGKHARLYIDDEDIYLRSFEMNTSFDTEIVDGSVYGDDFAENEYIDVNHSLDLQARMMDDYRGAGDVADQLLDKFFHEKLVDPGTGLAQETPANMSFIGKQSPAEGDSILFGSVFGGMSFSTPRRGLSAIRFNANGTGAVDRGKVIRLAEVTLTDLADTDNGPDVDLGDAVNYLRGVLHVVGYTVNSGSPTGVTATLQSDDNGSFTTPTARHAFTTFSDKYTEYLNTVVDYGDTDEDHHRLVLVGAGPGSWSVTVSLLAVAATG